MTLHERLIESQPIYELRRKARKAKRKQRLWTQEEIDLMLRKSNNDINVLLENYNQFNLDQRKYRKCVG